MRLSVVPLLAAGAIVLAACGSGSGRSQQSSPTTAVHPTTATPIWVYRAVAGPQAVTDTQGAVWKPGLVTGGVVMSESAKGQGATATGVTGSGTPQLYEQARVGVQSATIPVPTPGTYVVDLLMTEPSDLAAGQRVFDVTAGHASLKGVDIAKAVGDSKPLHRILTVQTTGATIDLSFVPRVGTPELSALAAFRLSGHQGLQTTWQDQFPGAAGSAPRGWTHTTGQTGFGNKESERYTAATANSQVDGKGDLVITVRHDGSEFTSARLDSRQSFQYGLVQAQIKLPYGQGLWPGFWMLADDIGTVGWPQSGEIDILESIGQQPRGVHDGVIGPATGGGVDQWYLGGSADAPTDLTRGFHTYGALWTPIGIWFLLDGQPIYSVTPEDLPQGDRWVQDRKYHLLLNVAVGGVFPGPVTSATPARASMIVKNLKLLQ